jgi:hypothetical protein
MVKFEYFGRPGEWYGVMLLPGINEIPERLVARARRQPELFREVKRGRPRKRDGSHDTGD